MILFLQVNELVEPLRDFFSCLFFASIGKYFADKTRSIRQFPGRDLQGRYGFLGDTLLIYFTFVHLTGLHVFPTFVLNELPLVLTLTLGVVSVKVGSSYKKNSYLLLKFSFNALRGSLFRQNEYRMKSSQLSFKVAPQLFRAYLSMRNFTFSALTRWQ